MESFQNNGVLRIAPPTETVRTRTAESGHGPTNLPMLSRLTVYRDPPLEPPMSKCGCNEEPAESGNRTAAVVPTICPEASSQGVKKSETASPPAVANRKKLLL